MKTSTGPYETLGNRAAQVREQAHKVAELRLMAKDLARYADLAFSLDCPILGETILTAATMARDKARLTETEKA